MIMIRSVPVYSYSNSTHPILPYSPAPALLNCSNLSRKCQNIHKQPEHFLNCSNTAMNAIGLGVSVKFEPLRAASEGLPTELIEDPKFVPLSEDDPRFGPPALLLVGFKYEEIAKIQTLLKDMGGEFLKVLLCTPDMIKLSLWDAMHTQQSDLKKVEVADGLPQICFLSGLTGEETLMFIDAFPEAGLESAVFAALVPNSAGKPVEELIEEIMGDHEILTRQKE
ncbi:uncharacterized protein LOC131073144 isoform X2 [Cryptomeria japonica]|uniref:uncharacterized protein LOC131073144 isoform X2 n=1 Tax=Cryptomeria japonica TaxID=3369 RepID=UPI0027DA6E53|nr:uncharacterized protein LOC131073144 isoform X2 [Cryptomeria japonica]